MSVILGRTSVESTPAHEPFLVIPSSRGKESVTSSSFCVHLTPFLSPATFRRAVVGAEKLPARALRRREGPAPERTAREGVESCVRPCIYRAPLGCPRVPAVSLSGRGRVRVVRKLQRDSFCCQARRDRFGGFCFAASSRRAQAGEPQQQQDRA